MDQTRLDLLRRISHDGTSYTWSNFDMRQCVDAIDQSLARIKAIREALMTVAIVNDGANEHCRLCQSSRAVCLDMPLIHRSYCPMAK